MPLPTWLNATVLLVLVAKVGEVTKADDAVRMEDKMIVEMESFIVNLIFI